jgi:hypothetical protein
MLLAWLLVGLAPESGLPGASSLAVGAQAPDPRTDLSVSFSSKHAGQEAGFVFGTVRNSSANAYPCVSIEFNLSTRFDMRKPGEPGRQLGVLQVEVENVQPRSTKDYRHDLPFPAGIGLKSVSVCATDAPPTPPETPPTPPNPPTPPQPPVESPATCSVSGRVTGKLRVVVDDPSGRLTGKSGRSIFVLTDLSIMSDETPRKLLHKVKLDGSGHYQSPNLTPGRSYLIAPSERIWNSQPRTKVVSCPVDRHLRSHVDFVVKGVMLEG